MSVNLTTGPDWNFGDQDGGKNEIGVVINKKKEDKKLIRVSPCFFFKFSSKLDKMRHVCRH